MFFVYYATSLDSDNAPIHRRFLSFPYKYSANPLN